MDGPAGNVDYLALDDAQLLRLCEVDTYRASGPGGQKRNKTDSAVRLRLPGLGLAVVGTESRSQHENRARALRRMRLAIALELRRSVNPDDYRPGDVLRGCLTGRSQLQVGRRDARYCVVVREVLDLLAACGMQVSKAATHLGISTSNLSAFLCGDRHLLGCVNRLRREAGMRSLR